MTFFLPTDEEEEEAEEQEEAAVSQEAAPAHRALEPIPENLLGTTGDAGRSAYRSFGLPASLSVPNHTSLVSLLPCQTCRTTSRPRRTA